MVVLGSSGDAARVAVELVLVVAGGLAAAVAAYQLVIAIAAHVYERRHARRAPGPQPAARVVVLIPAHDEEGLIARCLDTLGRQTYPRALYELVVIADNCTDETASVARAAGATVLVRDEPDLRGKGRALRWAIDLLRQRELPPDAIVVVDADSVAEPAFLAALAERFEAGAEVVQGESLLFEDGSSASSLRAAAFLLVNRVRPAGRAVLGLPSNLAGNGTLYGRRVLERMSWDAFTSAEDVEYSVKLRSAGVRAVFGRGAVLRSPGPPTSEAAEQQRQRWEGGKLHVARTQVPRLLARGLRERRLLLLDAAVELAVPPLGLLVAGTVLGASAAGVLAWVGLLASWTAWPWLLALVLLPLYVLTGLHAGHAPASAYRSLAGAPLLVVRKTVTAHRLLGFRHDTWVRTERAAAAESADAASGSGTSPR
jgi:hypothetical protein